MTTSQNPTNRCTQGFRAILFTDVVAWTTLLAQLEDAKMRNRLAATVRTVTGDERAALWTQMSALFPPYADYQQRTDREIPDVAIEPQCDWPVRCQRGRFSVLAAATNIEPCQSRRTARITLRNSQMRRHASPGSPWPEALQQQTQTNSHPCWTDKWLNG